VLAAVWGAGVHGLVSKADPLEQLLLAIKCAIDDKRYCSMRVDQILREIDVARGKANKQLLTNREVEVLRFFLGGLGTTEIAEHLGRSVKTISNQKWAAMRKLGCESDQALFELHAMGALKLGTQM
jgi:two-component system capsular synthesis response regulator RcsB